MRPLGRFLLEFIEWTQRLPQIVLHFLLLVCGAATIGALLSLFAPAGYVRVWGDLLRWLQAHQPLGYLKDSAVLAWLPFWYLAAAFIAVIVDRTLAKYRLNLNLTFWRKLSPWMIHLLGMGAIVLFGDGLLASRGASIWLVSPAGKISFFLIWFLVIFASTFYGVVINFMLKRLMNR